MNVQLEVGQMVQVKAEHVQAQLHPLTGCGQGPFKVEEVSFAHGGNGRDQSARVITKSGLVWVWSKHMEPAGGPW